MAEALSPPPSDYNEPRPIPPPKPEEWSSEQRQLSVEVTTHETRTAASVVWLGRSAGIDAESLWSETVEKFVNRNPDVPPDKRKNYLLAIARNLVFSDLRKQANARMQPYQEAIGADPVTEFESEVATKLIVQTAMQQLLPSRQRIIELIFFDDLSYPQAAAVLGISTGTVKSRLHHAKAQMRLILAGMGVANPYDSTQNQPDS